MNKSESASRAPAMLSAGAPAPDFSLYAAPNMKLGLRNFVGRPLILTFYPADWSRVCGDQLALYNEVLSDIHDHGAEMVGVSVDGVWCHAAFARDRNLHFPLISDFEPKGAVSRLYGVVRDDFRGGVRSGVNGTPTFFINGKRFEGRWSNQREFIRALRAAQSAQSAFTIDHASERS